MSTILNFSWRDFTAVEDEVLSVGRLLDEASARGFDPFVAHDRASRQSALVVPETLSRLTLDLDFYRSASVVTSGFFEALRRNQLTVRDDLRASFVARLAAWCEAEVVLVVDVAARPVGLFLPEVMARRLPQIIAYKALPPPPLAFNAAAPDLVAMLEHVESVDLDFHAEDANKSAPDPYICLDHGKPHTASFNPCRQHPGVSGATRVVSGR